MPTIELHLFITLVAWFIVYNEPLQEGFRRGFELYPNTVTDNLYSILSCWMCLTFWLNIIVTFDFFYTLIFTFAVWMLTKKST